MLHRTFFETCFKIIELEIDRRCDEVDYNDATVVSQKSPQIGSNPSTSKLK